MPLPLPRRLLRYLPPPRRRCATTPAALFFFAVSPAICHTPAAA
jgi:hypothetical protein